MTRAERTVHAQVGPSYWRFIVAVTIASVRSTWKPLVHRAVHAAVGPIPIRMHAKPDAIIIGAQRSGTTSLYQWLKGHPDFLPPVRKELHFFDQARAGSRADLSSYWQSFPLRPDMWARRFVNRRTIVTGEATPSYLFHPLVPARVFAALPDVRLVAVLRDPVERALSHYWHERNRGFESLSLELALDAEPQRMEAEFGRINRGEDPTPMFFAGSYVSRGRYAEQLARWTSVFPRHQIHVTTLDRLKLNPTETFAEICRFIGIDAAHVPVGGFDSRNRGRRETPPRKVTDRLCAAFQEPNRRLRAEYGIEFECLPDKQWR